VHSRQAQPGATPMSMDGPANGFVMYCHQIKIGDLFVLNTYKGKLCIKMMGYPREID
jgi:hypothetical protein